MVNENQFWRIKSLTIWEHTQWRSSYRYGKHMNKKGTGPNQKKNISKNKNIILSWNNKEISNLNLINLIIKINLFANLWKCSHEVDKSTTKYHSSIWFCSQRKLKGQRLNIPMLSETNNLKQKWSFNCYRKLDASELQLLILFCIIAIQNYQL